jgi:alanyl aminopeptidase
VDLTLIPGEPAFSGSVDIEVSLKKASALVWLNAAAIKIKTAAFTSGGKSAGARILPGGDDFVGLQFDKPLAAGEGVLHIEYSGSISDKGSSGIFQSKDDKDRYLFTQFESSDARRAFPCFDEPGFKNPWRLTLHTRQGLTAFANTPVVSETDEPAGMKRVVFAPTKPLPSYLIAFAVGPFEIVDAGRAGRNRVPVRILTPRGKADQAKYAVEVTGQIVERLEDYFGIPFPFEKLDSVAVPLAVGFGAMENAGLITYEQTIILSDPAIDTAQRQREYADVAAHEIAHQWFGDLVTLAWWDDTWLNEAFATWASSRILADWKPEWNTRLGDLSAKFGAMEQDSLVATRKIRQPIETKDDIANAFDEITYEKGSAVIRMFEKWAGEEQFKKGVHEYLSRHAYKNARVSDFLDALSGAGQPRLTGAFSTFLEQPGIPEVSVKLSCDSGPALVLGQKRYFPIGSAGTKGQVWQVPVCVRYKSGSGAQQECFLLDKPAAEFKLTRASGCPELLSANDAASGYYIVNYQGDLQAELLQHGDDFLSAAEKRTLLNDLQLLAGAGDLKTSKVLDAVPVFAREKERQIVSQAHSIGAGVRRLMPADLMPNYARFVTRVFGERARQLGWSARPGEDIEARLLRANLVPAVAREGEDASLRTEARRLADGWLADRKGVDSDMVGGVLSVAAAFGDRGFFDKLLAELHKIHDLQQRQHIIRALGSFRDPEIARASLDLLIHSDLETQEIAFLIFGPLGEPATERLPFDFVRAHYDELIKRGPSGGDFEYGAILPFVGQAFCDSDAEKEFVSFFERRAGKFTGGPRNYQQALEAIKLCRAQKAAQGTDIADFFVNQ